MKANIGFGFSKQENRIFCKKKNYVNFSMMTTSPKFLQSLTIQGRNHQSTKIQLRISFQ